MKINSNLQNTLTSAISAAIGRKFSISDFSATSGGSINTTYVVQGSGEKFFIKLNSAHFLSMFEAEFQALLEIERSDTIRVPHPITTGSFETHSWLVMEYLPLQNNGQNNGNPKKLGEQLAALHKITRSHFGWRIDNTIGSTPQKNTLSKNWPEFFRDNRLQYQLKLASSNGYKGALQQAGAALLDRVEDFFVDYTPAPSLLHGDLWSGNYAFINDETPVIYDPALYYGDRETDIAMTELFGGFSSDFRNAYEACWPLNDDYATRRNLYNCYHILNHLNLFGGGYARQAENMMLDLLSEQNG